MRPGKLLQIIGPGILVAATGVGAGDLAAASLTGSAVGLAVLWAVVVGALLKFVLNEGLTRWQLATGTTLLEGCAERLGRSVLRVFLVYLVVWSVLVAAALMSAAGVTAHAMFPLAGSSPEAAVTDKWIYGILHSLLAVALVKLGSYRLFEKSMAAMIAIMFVTVVSCAVAMRPPLVEVLKGLLLPTIPAGGASWTIALIGGIGGTVTILCYGYWIREEGREGIDQLSICRIDLATGYVMTAIFGLSMVVIGNSLGPMEGGGARLMVQIAEHFQATFGTAGPIAKWALLIGAWGAVFSSMLGVWQSVPYLFADLWQLLNDSNRPDAKIDTSSRPYQVYLYAIATVPILPLLAFNFQTMQKVYAVVGALFIPLLAVVLLKLNGRGDWVGEGNKNSIWTKLALVGALVLFAAAGAVEIRDTFL